MTLVNPIANEKLYVLKLNNIKWINLLIKSKIMSICYCLPSFFAFPNPAICHHNPNLAAPAALELKLHCALPSLYQGLSKHQEVSSAPATNVTKLIVVFWDLLDAIKR